LLGTEIRVERLASGDGVDQLEALWAATPSRLSEGSPVWERARAASPLGRTDAQTAPVLL
jgi:hypothetical protein